MDEGHLIPILFADARTGVGIPELLDAIARHFPSPEEGNPEPFLSYRGGEQPGGPQIEVPFEYRNDANRPLLAHVFKVTTDPFVGQAGDLPRASGKMHRAIAGVPGLQQKAGQAWAHLPFAGQAAHGGERDHRRGYRRGGQD